MEAIVLLTLFLFYMVLGLGLVLIMRSLHRSGTGLAIYSFETCCLASGTTTTLSTMPFYAVKLLTSAAITVCIVSSSGVSRFNMTEGDVAASTRFYVNDYNGVPFHQLSRTSTTSNGGGEDAY